MLCHLCKVKTFETNSKWKNKWYNLIFTHFIWINWLEDAFFCVVIWMLYSFKAIWRDDERRNKSVRVSSCNARGAASEHRHSQSSGKVRIEEQAGPHVGTLSQPSVSLSFQTDFLNFGVGEALWTGKEECLALSLWSRCSWDLLLEIEEGEIYIITWERFYISSNILRMRSQT